MLNTYYLKVKKCGITSHFKIVLKDIILNSENNLYSFISI